ncbi:MAG: glycosyltransferase family 2 protein [Thiohalocapsa sp.]
MTTHPFISIVLPAHNESKGLSRAVEAIEAVVSQCTDRYEFVIVDDGSTDDTYQVIEALADSNPHIRGIRFSRNFGKEAALLAGLDRATGDVVITMDSDLQHPPPVIPELLALWRQGYKVVNAVKQGRPGDSFMVRLRASVFNRMLSAVGGIDTRHSSDFKLLDRTAVNILINDLPERRRFYRGLSDWLGFEQSVVSFTVAERAAGEGKWSMLGLIDLAVTAIVSFTSAPLRVVTVLGVATLTLGFFVGTEALWSWFHGRAVSGFTTLITTLLILCSFIMISLGIIGEYIGKIYEEIKKRPVYLVASACGAETRESDDGRAKV